MARFNLVKLSGVMMCCVLMLHLNACTTHKQAIAKDELIPAVRSGNVKEVSRLLDAGADVNARGTNGDTPLFYASRHKDVAELLVARGADVNAVDSDGNTSLHVAAYSGNLELVDLLIAKGANHSIANRDGLTPLLLAVNRWNKDVAVLLIEKGANFNARSKDGISVLLAASYTGLDHYKDGDSKVLAEMLVVKGARIDDLYSAAFLGDTKATAELIAMGADVNAKGKTTGPRDITYTPLLVATLLGYKDVAELLIAHGANINARFEDGITPLFVAVIQGRLNVVELLLDKGADVNAAVKDGQTPLDAAYANGHKDIASLLIAKGAKINGRGGSK
jgi:ankyrin repeat protein